VTDLFNRLGSIGILLIAGALIVGGLTGAAVAHHYETLSTVPTASQQQQGDNSDSEQGSNAQQAENSDKPDAKPATKHNAPIKPAPKKAKPKPSASPSPKPSGTPEPDQVNNT
jgi:cytoskeletal protein RodZ